MKLIKIKLPFLKTIEFPLFKKLSLNLVFDLYIIKNLLLSILLILIPVYTLGGFGDSIVVYNILFLVTLAFFSFLMGAILSGKSSLDDAEGFIFILSYGLLITIGSVFKENSFGTSDIRVFSSLSTISIMGLFYLGTKFFNKYNYINLFRTLVYWGIIGFGVMTLFKPIDMDSILPMLAVILLLYKGKFLYRYLVIFTYVLLNIYLASVSSTGFLTVFLLLIFTLILILLTLKISTDFENIKNLFYKRSLIDVKNNIPLIVLFISPVVILILVSFNVLSSFGHIFKLIELNINYILDSWKIIYSEGKIFSVLFGTLQSGVSISLKENTISNLLISNGVLGLSGLLLIIGYGISRIYDMILKNNKLESYFIASTFLLIVFLMFFTQISFITFVIFIVSLQFIVTKSSSNHAIVTMYEDIIQATKGEYFIKNKKLRFISLFLIVVLFLFIINFIFKNIYPLILN